MHETRYRGSILEGFPEYKKGETNGLIRGRFFEVQVREALRSRFSNRPNVGFAQGQVEGEKQEIDLICYEGKPEVSVPRYSKTPEVVIVPIEMCRAFLELKSKSEAKAEQIRNLVGIGKQAKVPVFLVLREYSYKIVGKSRMYHGSEAFYLDRGDDTFAEAEFESLVDAIDERLG